MFRPTALYNIYYKIISKLFSLRLKKVLKSIIFENQSAFLPERSVTDNVLITYKVLQYLKTSQATQHCSMAVKTNTSKVYDRIEWNFVEQVLTRLGFHSKWVMWIMKCITTVSYSYLINDHVYVYGLVKPSRGIRQGDSLSPYIFILCGEYQVYVTMQHKMKLYRGLKLREVVLELIACYLRMTQCSSVLQLRPPVMSFWRSYLSIKLHQINR